MNAQAQQRAREATLTGAAHAYLDTIDLRHHETRHRCLCGRAFVYLIELDEHVEEQADGR